MRRKAETPAMVRRIMIAQGVIPCCLCGRRLAPGDKLIREHLHALALGGPDDEKNMGYAHEECAKFKTTGRKHMADGDSQKITKQNRLARGGKTKRGPKLQSRNDWPQGRKLQSRPFERRNVE
ncbi:MAG: hypothetical protein JJ939_11495 [Alphaproteobacteria bacterium]|nr:hypothetical protein [Alphaproteobacteria bacterium]MBO6629039.1 hypothetical protein [Alphaproteobacteria bacterium]